MIWRIDPNGWRQQITSRKKTLNYYIPWYSLHCFRSMTRRYAIFMASESNDFFLRDVRRNCPLRRFEE